MVLMAVVGTVLGVLGLGVEFVGLERIRVWLHLEDPPPHITDDDHIETLLLDPAVAPTLRLLQREGREVGWRELHDVGWTTDGYTVVELPGRARVHCVRPGHEELVLMVKPK